MRKTLLGFITFPLLFALGTYAYLWYSTKQQADQLIQMASLFADADYGSIFVSPFGTAGISDIKITPHGTYDSVRIESLSITAPSIFALSDLGNRFSLTDLSDLPEHLTFSVNGLKLPLYGAFFDNFTTETSAGNDMPALSTLGCGSLAAFGPAQLTAMGIDTVTVDSTFGYTYNKLLNRFIIKAEGDIRNLTGISWALDIPSANLLTSFSRGAPGSPSLKLATINLELNDYGYNDLRNRYCAVQTETDVAGYLNEHIRLVQQELRYEGLVPDDAMVAAYRQYWSTSNRLTVKLEPYSDVSLTDIRLDRLDWLVEASRMQVTLDGAAVPLAFSAIEPEPRPAVMQTAAGPLPDVAPAAGSLKPRQRRRLVYSPVAPRDLPRHVGKPSQVITADGRRHRGQLQAVKGDDVALKIYLSGGNATYWFNLTELQQVQIGSYSG